VLDGCEDVSVLRAAELFFRPQRVRPHEGSLIAADEETIASADGQPVSPLVAMLGLPSPTAIDVLVDDNAETYWERSDRFDMGFDLTAGRRGVAALAEVIARWVTHLMLPVTVERLIRADNVDLTWYVGLDAQGTRIGDALWNGEELDELTRSRIIGLFHLTVTEERAVLDKARGKPIYLIMAMTPDGILRVKPQNLVTGLPLLQAEAVS
jgi:hypothetical protein